MARTKTIGITVDDVTVSIQADVLGSWDTMKLIRDASRDGDEGVFATIDLIQRVLGDQLDTVETALREKHGDNFSYDCVVEWFVKLLASPEPKN